MDDWSSYCDCSPIIEIPTTNDLLHPSSNITPEEMQKYRMMQYSSALHYKSDLEFSQYKVTSHVELSQYKATITELDITKNRDFKCAEAGLTHYNKMNLTNYKLVEATDSHGFFCGWAWYHCVFKAAPETSSVPEVFFAELHALGTNKYHVITVAHVNGAESHYCSYCEEKEIPHPVLTLSRDSSLLYSEGVIYRGSKEVPLEQCQEQEFAEKERMYMQVIQQLQLELASARGISGTDNTESSMSKDESNDRSSVGLCIRNQAKSYGGSTTNGASGVLTNGNTEKSGSFVLGGNTSAQAVSEILPMTSEEHLSSL